MVNMLLPSLSGVPEFVDLALKFAYGADNPAIADKRIAGVQVSVSSPIADPCRIPQCLQMLSQDYQPHYLHHHTTMPCSRQTISGTGANRLAGEFYKKFTKGAAFYVPDPTW